MGPWLGSANPPLRYGEKTMTAPWNIPVSWEWLSIGDVATIVGGGTPSTSDAANFEEGRVPWITPADLSGYSNKFISQGARNITERGLKSSSSRMLPQGTVLMSSRAPIGYVAIASVPLCTNQGFKSFVLQGGIEPSFVYYHLLRSRDLIKEMGVGTTFKEVSAANASRIPFPLPPLAEQHRIVAEIEKAADTAGCFGGGAAACAGQPQTLPGQCAEGRLRGSPSADGGVAGPRRGSRVRARRATAPAHSRGAPRQVGVAGEAQGRVQGARLAPTTSALPELPEGWVWNTFEQFVFSLEGGTSFTAVSENTGRPVLRSSAVRQGAVNLQDLRYLPSNAP